MSKHTAGPWISDDTTCDGAVYCSDRTGSIVARTTGAGFELARRPRGEWKANERLIAAAPMMFDALTSVLALLNDRALDTRSIDVREQVQAVLQSAAGSPEDAK